MVKIERVSFSQFRHIRPACLPDSQIDEYEETSALVTGWGLTGLGLSGTVAQSLQVQNVLIMQHRECQDIFKNSVTEQMICIKGLGENIGSTCPGDSGSGIMKLVNGMYEVVGIVSWDTGNVGCQDRFPTVATKVTSILEWIKGEISDSFQCSIP